MKLSFIFKIILSAFIVLFGLALICFALIATEAGSRLTLDIAKRFIPGELHYKTIKGNLINKITLEQPQYTYQKTNISAKNLQVRLQLSELFKSKSIGANVEANGITLSFNNKNYQIKSINLQANSTLHRLRFTSSAQLLGGTINSNGTINLKPLLNWNIQFNTQHINLAKQWPTWTSKLDFVLKTQGNADQYTIDLSQLKGTLANQNIHGNANFSIAKKHIKQFHVQLNSGDASINASGSITDQWNANWNINIPKLSRFNTNARGKIISQGNITGPYLQPLIKTSLNVNNLEFNQYAAKTLKADFAIDSSSRQPSTANIIATNIEINDYPIEKFKLYGTGTLKALKLTIDTNVGQLPIHGIIQTNTTSKGLMTTANISTPNQSPLKVTLNLPGYYATEIPALTQPIDGQLSWKTTNLSFLSQLTPTVSDIKGKLTINGQISGTLIKPIISGTAQLTGNNLTLPEQQITLKNININATIKKNLLTYHAELTSNGKLTLKGQTELTKGVTSTLTIKGKEFLVSNTSELQLYLSPDLQIKIKDKRIDITGNAIATKAMIAPHDFSSTQTLSDDVVFIDAKQTQKRENHLQLYSNLTLIAGKDVKINIKGLTGNLIGKITLTSEPHKKTLANGQLNIINGYFNAYGQKLKLADGQLTYINSPIDNPLVNIRAIQTIKKSSSTFTLGQEDLIVGVNIKGKIKQPTITLFSQPLGLSQAEILSYLILGVPLNTASQDNGQLLLRAASALNIGGGGGVSQLASQIKQTLGLSEFGIETESQFAGENGTVTRTTSLVLGKYLSPKLYLQYSIGLLEPVNTLRVQYFLSKKWSIQTENNDFGTGADLLYTFARG